MWSPSTSEEQPSHEQIVAAVTQAMDERTDPVAETAVSHTHWWQPAGIEVRTGRLVLIYALCGCGVTTAFQVDH